MFGHAWRNAASTMRVCVRANSLPRVPRMMRSTPFPFQDEACAPLNLSRQRWINQRRRFSRAAARANPARQPRLKIRDMLGDDLLAGCDLLSTQCQRLFRDRLQRIDVVEVDAVEIV